MQASKVEVGQHFKLATDDRILKRLAYDNGVFGVDADNNLVGVHPDSSCELAGAETPGDHITGALRFTINHHDPDNGRTLSGRIEVNNLGLDVFFDGYGQHNMAAGFGSPVFMEVDDDGHPVVHCWAEIDSEDPTHKIRLHGAKDNRPV